MEMVPISDSDGESYHAQTGCPVSDSDGEVFHTPPGSSDDDPFHTPTGSPPSDAQVPAPHEAVQSFPKTLYTAQTGEDTCSICREEYEKGQSITTLPCRHVYHTTCIESWLTGHNGVCPYCMIDVCAPAPTRSTSGAATTGSTSQARLFQAIHGFQAPQDGDVHVHDEVVDALPNPQLLAPLEVVESLLKRLHTSLTDEYGSSCDICLSEYKEGESITTLPCNDYFHSTCVETWLNEYDRLCPVCKRDICVPAPSGSTSDASGSTPQTEVSQATPESSSHAVLSQAPQDGEIVG